MKKNKGRKGKRGGKGAKGSPPPKADTNCVQDTPGTAHQPYARNIDEGINTTSIFSKLQEDSPNWIVTVAGLVHTSLLDLILAPVTTMLGYQSLMPLSPALCPWGIVRCSTAFFILHSKQTIVSMARNVHRWVQQSAHRPLSPTPSGPFRPPTRQLSSRVERQLLDLMTNEEVISLLERGLREDSPLCTNDKKRFIMVLEKMCDNYERLPPSYEITGELEWTEENLIGRGGKADVWRGVYEGFQVAVKVLRVDLGMDLVALEKGFCREVVKWKQFKHPNLLPFVGTKKVSQTLMIVSEWMEHGTIMEFVTARPESNRLKLLADVARGLKYLHDWPTVHADLKSSNVLIDGDRSARIADFGLTSLLRHPSISVSVGTPDMGGTPGWMAPELFDENSHPSRESDIYAFGMIVYEVFAHERPFPNVTQLVASVLTLAGERPPRPVGRDILGLSKNLWMLIQQCWNKDPSTRPRIADILVHFESTYHNWVSPAPEEIANLNLGRTLKQFPSTTESIDTLSEVGALRAERPAGRRRLIEPRTAGKIPVPIYLVFIFCGMIYLWVTILDAWSM